MVARTRTDGVVAQIMRKQLGLITSKQAQAAGVPAAILARRVAEGSLVRAWRGVYMAADVPRTWEQSALAACLAVGPAAVLSHSTAATAWKLDLPERPYVELTVPFDRSGRPPDGPMRLHRSRVLGTLDQVQLGRFKVTTLARTLVDLSGSLPAAVLARVADAALCRRLTTPAQVERALDRLAAQKPREVRALRDAIAPWLAGAQLESVAEGTFLRAVRAARLPAPRTQHTVISPDGTRFRLDFAWPDRMLLLEVDGFRWHANPDAHAADSRRANVLASLGWTVLRATPKELEQGASNVLAALTVHLGGERRRGAATG